MEGPANTLTYLIAGFAVIFGIMLIYLVSLLSRWNNLRKDAELLKELEKKE
ncbi:MAG: hypothetical protein GYA20_05265 [Chloroflexi bacterium]|jgi:hypothetical protein|nr:hypothetical protein [Chloroflexota bacterium]